MSEKKSALFICLGNICRSPIAEAVFITLLKERNITEQWIVDSAAMASYHIGKGPDERAMSTLKAHKVIYSHKVRQIQNEDFQKFDFIFGMDNENMRSLNRQAPAKSTSKLLLLGDFDPQGDRIIRDPYYDDDDIGFEKCYQQCIRSCASFLDKQQ